MIARALRFLVLLLAVGFASSRAPAQVVVPETIDSIDVKVLNAKSVMIGTVATTSKPADGPEWRRDATLRVEETLKGKPVESVRATEYRVSGTVDEWKAKASRVLIFVSARDERPVSIDAIDLDDPALLVPKADLGFFRNRDELLRYVRELIRKHPGAEPVKTFVIPPEGRKGEVWKAELNATKRHSDLGGLRVPVDDRLKRWAQEALRSEDELGRRAGLGAIRFFKSADDVARVRRLLVDPAYYVLTEGTDNRGIETRRYPVRAEAYDVLRAWGEPVDPPAFEASVSTLETLEWLRLTRPEDLRLLSRTKRLKRLELLGLRQGLTDEQFGAILGAKELTELSLAGAGIDDARLAELARLRRLRALNLSRNPVTDAGLRTLARFPSLVEVRVDSTEITEEGLAFLGHARPEITIDVDRRTLAYRNLRPIVPTDAECERTAYASLVDDLLEGWSSGEVGPMKGSLEWSRTPSGRPYIGPLDQQTARLELENLPEHCNVCVEIELFAIGSWDGDGSLGAGPDILDVTIPGVGTMLHSTFFNNDEDHPELELQSFPESYGAGRHRAYTGAQESRTLGFGEVWDGQTYRRDAVYRIRATFAHAGPRLEIVFNGLTVSQADARSILDDERWGIGRVVVRTD